MNLEDERVHSATKCKTYRFNPDKVMPGTAHGLWLNEKKGKSAEYGFSPYMNHAVSD